MVLSVDVRRRPSAGTERGHARRHERATRARWEVVTPGGRNPTGRDAVEWVREGVERGAGEVLLTSIDSDGTRGGYDLALLRAVTAAVPVPVIASGGAGEPAHLAAAARGGRRGRARRLDLPPGPPTPSTTSRRRWRRRASPVRREPRADEMEGVA